MAHSLIKMGVASYICIPTKFLHTNEVQVPADRQVISVFASHKYRCSVTQTLPLLDVLESLCKVTDAEPAWKARVEAIFLCFCHSLWEHSLNSGPPGWLCVYYFAK